MQQTKETRPTEMINKNPYRCFSMIESVFLEKGLGLEEENKQRGRLGAYSRNRKIWCSPLDVGSPCHSSFVVVEAFL